MRKALLLAALFYSSAIGAQSAAESFGTVVPELTAYSTPLATAYSFRTNSSSLATLDRFSAALYSERRFLLNELSSHSFALALPTTSGGFGLRGDYAGHSFYYHASAGLGYGRKLGQKLRTGAQFLFYHQSAAGYGSASFVSFEASALLSLAEGVNAGLSVQNPIGLSTGKAGEGKIPAMYATGIGWDVSPQLFVGAQLQKTEDRPLAVKAGIHYAFAEKFYSRVGLNSGVSAYGLSFGLVLRRFRLESTVSLHPYLGATPGLMLLYLQAK